MPKKGLTALFSIVSIASLVLLILPHLLENMRFLAQYNWYNGLLAIILIFSSVSLWVIHKQKVREEG